MCHRELTRRESEILALVVEGYTNKEIAKQLGIRERTVQAHRANMMNKLAARNLVQLIRHAVQRGLVVIEND